MKPHNIDLETVEGLLVTGSMVEVSGAMTVAADSHPLEGVHQSALRMNLATAARLHAFLGQAIERERKNSGRI